MSTYAAEVTTTEGVVVEGGKIRFTDPANQPGSVMPAVVNAAALPTADPHIVGHLWADTGVLTVSAG